MKKKILKRVALYLPLGSKREAWSGVGGAEKRLSYLLSHMDSSKFQVTIVFRDYKDHSFILDKLRRYISDDCKIVFVNNEYQAFMHFFKEKYDCVYFDDYMVSAKAGITGARMAKSKCVLIMVTEYYARWSFRKKWHGLIMAHNVALAHRIDTLYPWAEEVLAKKFPSKPISVTPCSLPFMEKFIEKCNDVEKRPTIVFASRLVELKNPMMLAEAANIAKKEIRENGYKIQICGSGPLSDDLTAYIAQNDCEDIVEMMGVQDMEEILPQAKVFCSLQCEDNYPSQSLLEAMACGCLCIATDVGHTRLIVNDTFGRLVKADARSLAQVIREIVTLSDEAYRSIQEQTISFAKDTYDARKAIAHYERISELVINH